MKRGLYTPGAAILLTLLLTPAVGIEWVNVGGHLNPATNPQRVFPPAAVGDGRIDMIGRGFDDGSSPELGMPMMLEYVYIDPGLYSIFSYPWYGPAGGMRWQSLYTKDLIGRPGKIHEMALFKSYYPTYYNGTFPNVTVKLCHTTLTVLTSNLNNNRGGNTPVTVFHASSLTRGYQHGSDEWGWDTVDFDTDFDYDSSKNLLVEVTWQGSASGYSYTWGTYNSAGPLGAYYYGDSLGNSGSLYYYKFNTRIGFVPPANNVGVSKIISPADAFSAYGDTVYPICVVNNRGTAEQDNVPVRCKINEHRSGTVVYNQVQHVNLPPGAVDTVCFPGFLPPVQEALYDDTMRTENPGDARPGDDMQATWFKVAEYGSVCASYNDGTFDNAISWNSWGWWATKYAQPPGGACSGANFWMTTFDGADAAERVQLYGNDGADRSPGTMLYDTAVVMHTSIWTSIYKNHYDFASSIPVDYDSFFVAVYMQTWRSGSGYVYLGLCFARRGPDDAGWGKYQNGPWGAFYASGGHVDFGIDYCYAAPLIDASCVGITTPPATIDSNTTFTPVIQIKNTGLHDRKHVPYTFHIVRDVAPFDTVYTGSGDAGAIKTGKTVDVTLSNPSTPLPDHYTLTAFSNARYDGRPSNDTFVGGLFVRYLDVNTQISSPRTNEVPGLVPVKINLINRGNVAALVPRVDVTIRPGGYTDYRENIEIPAGANQIVTFIPWVCPAAVKETCLAWITYPADMNHGTLNDGRWNDTAQTVVTSGIPGWAQLTPLPAPPSGKFITVGGCMAYDAATDKFYASKGNKTGDFYTYDVNAGTWMTQTTIPLGAEGKGPSKGSVITSDGNGNLYLTKGNNTVGFWGYKESPTAAGAWTQLTNVPTGSSGKKVKQGASLAWATKAGVGAVYLLKGYRNEFHRYNPVTNVWEALLDAPIGTAGRIKWDAGSWIITDPDAGNMIYAFKSKYHEFYVYDCETGTWSGPKTAMPIPGTAGNKKAKDGSCAAWYGGKIYAFKGGNTNEFWRYFPLGDSWKKQDDIPLYGTSGSRKKVKAGAALAAHPGTGIYGFKGNKSLEFWRYTPYDVVGAQPSRDGVTGNATEIGSVSFAIAPNPLSGGFATVRYNLPKAGLATLNVFDVTGRTVLSQTMAAGRTGTASLDLRKLEAGVYLLKVTTEGFSTTQKLVMSGLIPPGSVLR